MVLPVSLCIFFSLFLSSGAAWLTAHYTSLASRRFDGNRFPLTSPRGVCEPPEFSALGRGGDDVEQHLNPGRGVQI